MEPSIYHLVTAIPPMASPVIICRVKALYDFQSTDPSSLTFKKDDEIDVLAQLESGWWDGWCNGERGWFPCNYVQVVEEQESGEESDAPGVETEEDDITEDEEDEEEEEEDDLDAVEDGRLAMQVVAHVKEPWIPQTTPDGIIFYFNTQTRESSWDVPLTDADPRDDDAGRAGTATPNAASSARTSLPISSASSDRAATPRAGSPVQVRARRGKANGNEANGNATRRHSRQQLAAGARAPGADLPADWVLQQTEDGMGYYYFNTVTEEMRWEHPLEQARVRSGAGERSNGSISDDDMSDEIDDENEGEEDEMEEELRRDEDAAEESETEDADAPRRRKSQPDGGGFADEESLNGGRKSVTSSNGSRLSGNLTEMLETEVGPQLGDDIEDDEKLPPNWVKKVTAQGRFYYGNVVTQETAWTLEDVDPQTGQLLSKKDRNSTSLSNSGVEGSNSISELPAPTMTTAPQPLPRSPSRQSNGYRRKNLLDPNEPLTWSKLAANIALSIHNLNTSAKNAQRILFVPHASAIVESIRLMLYASGTIEKEPPHIKTNRVLKNYHRAIMASLSKLVLSAKLASGVWPPADAILKMQNDANEVLVAARDFVNTAQVVGVEVRHVDPRLVPGLQNWRQRNGPGPGRRTCVSNGLGEGQGSRYSLQEDLHNNLEFYARNMAKSLTLLIAHAKNAAERPPEGRVNSPLAAATPLLIAQFRGLSTQISQFINIVEDIAIDDTLPSVGEFRLAKQSLYNAVGLLFNATQNVTDPNTPEHVSSKAVDAATRNVEGSLWDICDSVKGMMLERQEKLKAPVPAPAGPAPVPEGYANGSGPYGRRGSSTESGSNGKARSRFQSRGSRDITREVDTVHEEEEDDDEEEADS
ncbi:hypothetical protein BC936DRAFT_137699, partial [Jimgerdemannia flammicorona]